MKSSKYLAQLTAAIGAAGEGGFILPGSLLLVEKLPVEEMKTKSGLIIADNSKHQVNSLLSNAPQEVVVVALGEGFDDEGTPVPVDSQCGDILIVGDNAVKWLATFPIDGYEPNTLGICGEENTQLRFRGCAAYEAFKKGAALSSTSKPANEQETHGLP